MERRKFLKLLSVSSLLALGSPTALLAKNNRRFTSEALGFTFFFPPTWQAMTAFDDIDRHLDEWGGLDKDHRPPLVFLSKYQEPTTKPNYEFSVYACEPLDGDQTTIDIETAFETFQFLQADRDDMFDLNTSVDCSMFPWSGFGASWRTKGVDGKNDFLGHYFLLSGRPKPLLLGTCQPRTADDSELASILKSFRNRT